MTVSKKSIYDADYCEELKDYTLTLLMYLEKHNKLAPGTVNYMFRNCIDEDGKLRLNKPCAAKIQKGRVRRNCPHMAICGSCYCEEHQDIKPLEEKKPQQVELEYFIHNGKPFYIQFETKDVYTYGEKPKHIGKYDFDNDAIIACANL